MEISHSETVICFVIISFISKYIFYTVFISFYLTNLTLIIHTHLHIYNQNVVRQQHQTRRKKEELFCTIIHHHADQEESSDTHNNGLFDE